MYFVITRKLVLQIVADFLVVLCDNQRHSAVLRHHLCHWVGWLWLRFLFKDQLWRDGLGSFVVEKHLV